MSSSTQHQAPTAGVQQTARRAGQIDPRGPQFNAILTSVVLALTLLTAPGPVGVTLLAVQAVLFATGVLLAFARATGETAPLLLTVLGNNNISVNLLAPMAALPLLTYKYTDTPFPAQNTLAWGTALVLTVLVLGVNLLVRWATRSRLK